MPDSVTGRPLLLGVLRIKELSILLVTIAAAGYFTATSDAFNSAENYQTIAQYVAPWAIIAAGQVMLLICGEIDLSAGFVFTLAPFTLTLFSVNGAPLWLALLGSVLLSTLIGVVNGLIRTVLNIPSFITTLGMAFLLQGLVLIISDARPVSAPSGNWLVEVFGGAAWSEFAWAVVIVALMQVVLSATRFGIHTQAAGGNPVGAAESGIPVNRVKIVNFAIISTLAGLAGILQGTRVGSYDPTNGGFTMMFFAVASAVIGGTALLGGSGTVVGAFLGALLLGIVFDGFNLTGVSANAFNVVLGAAILLAMVLNVSLLLLRKRLGSRELS
ncbi:ABC transporter permease [Amycolatopsis magusensis]|uniref:Simple sugar transport system permease protein n=1 Tax=Amycolatopsis magusensis TaxID=882444 RepID=A0ABS4PTJ6_9PSEU|nr:ABC transporter permease [Amycolatopsis magusensis]MBP2182638.1 simple sugar transport system permease protein [Amycolatopsis magusensis]MDI5982238.1 ABC transporter permease [Amycolatopsis magusensis]